MRLEAIVTWIKTHPLLSGLLAVGAISYAAFQLVFEVMDLLAAIQWMTAQSTNILEFSQSPWFPWLSLLVVCGVCAGVINFASHREIKAQEAREERDRQVANKIKAEIKKNNNVFVALFDAFVFSDAAREVRQAKIEIEHALKKRENYLLEGLGGQDSVSAARELIRTCNSRTEQVTGKRHAPTAIAAGLCRAGDPTKVAVPSQIEKKEAREAFQIVRAYGETALKALDNYIAWLDREAAKLKQQVSFQFEEDDDANT